MTFGLNTLPTHWHRHLHAYMYSRLYSKTCRKRLLKRDQLSLNAGQKYCRMLQGEHSAILSTFIKLPFVIKIFCFVFFEWLLKTCFTVLTTYMYFLFCGVRRLPARWIFLLKWDFSQLKWMGPLAPLPWKVMGHILKSWDNDPGPP